MIRYCRQPLTDKRVFVLLGSLLLAAAMPLAAAEPTPATGPLRVHPTNHRYFADASGKAVFLTGSHTWANFQPNAYEKTPSPPPPDFDAYLAFMAKYNQNFFRLWTWEYTINPKVVQGTVYYGPPMAFLRSGPGLAIDGKPKFDLTQFDQSFFDRMRTFVTAARDKGIYASVMLFQGFRFGKPKEFEGDHWQGHYLNPEEQYQRHRRRRCSYCSHAGQSRRHGRAGGLYPQGRRHGGRPRQRAL